MYKARLLIFQVLNIAHKKHLLHTEFNKEIISAIPWSDLFIMLDKAKTFIMPNKSIPMKKLKMKKEKENFSLKRH